MNNYKKIILDNGIPLYIYIDKNLKQVFVNYIVKYGSDGKWFDFELDKKHISVSSGYAHYLEHLLGEHSKYGNMYNNFEERCYYSNAYTAYDHTSYYFYGVNDVKQSIKELIEAIDCPVFDLNDVEQTRHAIEEEASIANDDYGEIAIGLVEKNLYASYDVYDDTLCCIGNRKTTKNINCIDLYNCYNAFYTNDNKILVIAGNVEEKEIVDYLNEVYSKISYRSSSVVLPKYDLEPIRKKEEVIYRDVISDINSMGIKIKKPDSIFNVDLQIFIDFLLEYLYSEQSDFYNELKNKGLLDVLHYAYTTWNNNFINFIHSFVSTCRDDYYNVILEKINKKDMQKEDFELIKRGLIANEVRKYDDKYNAPSEFGNKMCYTDNYSLIDTYIKFNYEKFMDIFNQLKFDTYTTGIIKSLKK